MPRYQIKVDIVKVTGFQMYEVEADSEQEARLLWEYGEVEFIDENISVDEVGSPEITVA